MSRFGGIFLVLINEPIILHLPTRNGQNGRGLRKKTPVEFAIGRAKCTRGSRRDGGRSEDSAPRETHYSSDESAFLIPDGGWCLPLWTEKIFRRPIFR